MATIFGKPVVGVGMALPFNFSPSGLCSDIGIPKLLRHKITKELLDFDTIYGSGLSEFRNAEEIEKSDFELVEHSPQEVREVVEEMYLRLRNHWVETPEDQVLQEKINALLRPGSYSYGTASRCGALFLRRYSTLF
jgi:putative glycosyltransferase (TIGR04372 family)